MGSLELLLGHSKNRPVDDDDDDDSLHLMTYIMPRCYRSISGHRAKSAGGRLQLHTHTLQRWHPLSVNLDRFCVGKLAAYIEQEQEEGRLVPIRASLESMHD